MNESVARIVDASARHYLTGQDRRRVVRLTTRFLKTGKECTFHTMWRVAKEIGRRKIEESTSIADPGVFFGLTMGIKPKEY